MYKLISVKNTLGYSAVIAFCSMLISGNLNVLMAIAQYDGFDFRLMNQNQRVTILSVLYQIGPVETLLFRTAIVVSAIFIFATIAATVENQVTNLAKLSLLGANQFQIITVFLKEISRPFGVAMVLGVTLGMEPLSRVIAAIYPAYSGESAMQDFCPKFHFLSVVYSLCIVLGLFFIAILTSLRKLLVINPLGITAGRYKDLSRISTLRLGIGLLVSTATVWFYFTANMNTSQNAGNNCMTLIILIISSTYLLLPFMFMSVIPQVFWIICKFFPVTGLLAHRYFHATSRKYLSFSAPILICLMFSSAWFLMMENGKIFAQKLISQSSMATVVARGIDPYSATLLHKYLSVQYVDNNALALPIRQDTRWAEKNNERSIPNIWEVDPRIFSQVVPHMGIVAGDLSQVHGRNIASARPKDRVGDIIHLITPAGKNLEVTVVAILRRIYFHDLGFVILADYQSFPEANTNHAAYDIFYAGVNQSQLHAAGLSVITYNAWLQKFFQEYFHQRDLGNNLFIYPIVAVCIALCMINSGILSAHSRFIRRLMSFLGGSAWQDIRLMVMELGLIFSLLAGLTYCADIIVGKMFSRFFSSAFDVHAVITYPYHSMLNILIMLIIAVGLLPMIKVAKLRFRKI